MYFGGPFQPTSVVYLARQTEDQRGEADQGQHVALDSHANVQIRDGPAENLDPNLLQRFRQILKNKSGQRAVHSELKPGANLKHLHLLKWVLLGFHAID